jgi:hypothetical protein
VATWNALTLGERGSGSGTFVPVHGGAASLTARAPVVGSGSVDAGGRTIARLQMPIKCGSATLASLYGDVGENHSLVYAGGTVDAVLVEISSAVEVKPLADTYFAALDFLIITGDVTVQDIDATVTIAGTAYHTTLLEATISHGTEQDAGQATLVFPARPAAATEGGSVGVSLGYGGALTARFAGTVTGRSWEHWPTGVAVDCRDRMEYLTYPYGGTERTYTAQTDGTVVQNLVEAMGIASANTSIEDNGWTVGVVEPLIFRAGDRVLPLVREIDSLAGYVTFTKGADSAVYRRVYDESATGAGTHTLTKGVNILSARREISREGIYNGVQVDGLTYEGASVSVYMATANTDIRNPPGTVAGPPVNSNLIETSSRASVVAGVFLDPHNFKPETFSFTLPGTAIEPMDMLTVTHADLELSSRALVVVQVEDKLTETSYTTTVRAKKVTV